MTTVIREVILAAGTSLTALIIVKITVTWALSLSAAWLARRSRAALRHALLTAAFGVTLILPIASILAPPVHIAVPLVTASRTASHALLRTIDATRSVTPVNTGVRLMPTIPEACSLSLSALLIAGWIVGTALALLPMFMGLRLIHSMRQSGLRWLHGQAVVEGLAAEAGIHRRVEILLYEDLPGPMTCGIVHPVIVLPPTAATWEAQDLNRAMVHELEHVRRCDWVSQCFARAVCALYWFHPLVWIAWRRLLLEAERSCDDAVLDRSEATAYADQLVCLARRQAMTTKSHLLAMANRVDLATRVGAVLDSRQRRGRVGTFSVALACGAAIAAVVAVSPLMLIATPQAVLKFESVSIKPYPGDRPIDIDTLSMETAIARHPMGGRFDVQGLPLNVLIELAYDVKGFQLSGGPSWASSDRYDVIAKAEDNSSYGQMQPMLQALLADRFKLVLHRETRETEVYELSVAKSGLKLVPAEEGSCIAVDPNNPPPARSSPPRICGGETWQIMSAAPDRRVRVTVFAITMPRLVDMLSEKVGRTVIDKTGFKEPFDFQLEFAPDETLVGRLGSALGDPRLGPLANQSGPSISSAVQEQLGLHLESSWGPVEMLVIDGVERPSEN